MKKKKKRSSRHSHLETGCWTAYKLFLNSSLNELEMLSGHDGIKMRLAKFFVPSYIMRYWEAPLGPSLCPSPHSFSSPPHWEATKRKNESG